MEETEPGNSGRRELDEANSSGVPGSADEEDQVKHRLDSELDEWENRNSFTEEDQAKQMLIRDVVGVSLVWVAVCVVFFLEKSPSGLPSIPVLIGVMGIIGILVVLMGSVRGIIAIMNAKENTKRRLRGEGKNNFVSEAVSQGDESRERSLGGSEVVSPKGDNQPRIAKGASDNLDSPGDYGRISDGEVEVESYARGLLVHLLFRSGLIIFLGFIVILELWSSHGLLALFLLAVILAVVGYLILVRLDVGRLGMTHFRLPLAYQRLMMKRGAIYMMLGLDMFIACMVVFFLISGWIFGESGLGFVLLLIGAGILTDILILIAYGVDESVSPVYFEGNI